MPRSLSPHDSAASSMEAVGNGTTDTTSNGNGSGGGLSSSCSSEDDDGGECSLDSFRSELHSSAEDCGAAAPSPAPLNGIEVKPCNSIDSLSSSSGENAADGIAVRAQRPLKMLLDGKDRTSPPDNSDSDFGGRLRFYLDGNCVLELRHDLDDEGHPKQWIQSWGKTYHPLPLSSLPLPPPAWHPKELSSQDSQGRKLSPLPAAVTLSPVKSKKKVVNRQYLTCLVLRRRNLSSHPLVKSTILPACVLRRAARCPGRTLRRDVACCHGTEHHTCRKMAIRASHPFTSVEKLLNISSITEDLIHKNDDLELESKSLVECVQAKEDVIHTDKDTQMGLREGDQERQRSPGDSEEDAANRPLPEWYFDPTKASIPVTEMIGYPRPSLPASQKLSSPVKRDSAHVPEARPSDDASPTPKRIKECQDGLLDVQLHGRPLSSSQANAACCATSPCGVAADKKEARLSPASEGLNDEPVLRGDDLSPAQEAHSSGAVCKTPLRDFEGMQRKRKKGGYGRGRTIGEAVRAFVIGDILNLGGDVRTKYVPRGVFTEVASRYKIDATTTYRWWLKYCNGIRMASNGMSSPSSSSQKPFLLPGLTAGPSNPHALPGETKSPINNLYEKFDKQRQSIIRQSSVKKERFSSLNSATEHSPTKEFGRASLGGSHSPRSDDSASSGASLVDPASLYVSSMAFVPPNGAWQPNMPLPTLANGRLSLPVHRLPLPVGICMPYLWNYPAVPPYVNGLPNTLLSSNGSEKADSQPSSDEPLDLTLPKKQSKSGDHTSSHLIVHSAKGKDGRRLNSPSTYSECTPNKLILKQLLSVHEQQLSASTNLVETGKKCKSSKLIAKGIGPHSTYAQHNIKPKHYPFLSLQIGTFEIQSSISPSRKFDKEYFKENPNKFKVIFTQRKFVYEFETDACMEMSCNGRQEKTAHSQKMACIVVPFSIVEAFWCCGATIVLRVLSKPFMFLGQRLKQAGCVPNLTVYETKNSVDLTGGQLSVAQLHKVTLLKPRLVEQLKIYLVLFDIRFQNLMSPSTHDVLDHPGERVLQTAKQSNDQKT